MNRISTWTIPKGFPFMGRINSLIGYVLYNEQSVVCFSFQFSRVAAVL